MAECADIIRTYFNTRERNKGNKSRQYILVKCPGRAYWLTEKGRRNGLDAHCQYELKGWTAIFLGEWMIITEYIKTTGTEQNYMYVLSCVHGKI